MKMASPSPARRYAAMITGHIAVISGFCLVIARGLSRPGSGVQQFCQTEAFQATCTQPDEIIYVKQAVYGRMELGRCVQTDYGHVGCHTDVMRQTDRRCSGKRMCRITIPDAEFDLTKPCPVEFKTYFQIEYKCLKVIIPPQTDACSQGHLPTLTEQAGYISSIATKDRDHVALTCAWRITLPKGQKINITLTDFSTPEHEDDSRSSGRGYQGSMAHDECKYPYALLTERVTPERTVNVCGGQIRERQIYKSKSNSLDVRIIASNAAQFGNENFFVLRYRAVGCPDPEPPRFGWAERDVDGALMGCNYSAMTWRLFCDDTAWVGSKHNCSAEPIRTSPPKVAWGSFSLSYGVSVGVIVGLAVIIGVIVLLVGLICLEWRKMRRVERAEMIAQNLKFSITPDLLDQDDHYERRVCSLSPSDPVAHSEKDVDALSKDTDYTYVREMWPLAPPAPCNVNGQTFFCPEEGVATTHTTIDLTLSPSNSVVKATCRSPTEGDSHIYDSPRKFCADGTLVKSDKCCNLMDTKRNVKENIIELNYREGCNKLHKPCLL